MWDDLGPEMQRRMLKCPCNDPDQEGDKGDKPHDAVHMLFECNATKLVRPRVREAMTLDIDIYDERAAPASII